jgi:hypothetical protein
MKDGILSEAPPAELFLAFSDGIIYSLCEEGL